MEDALRFTDLYSRGGAGVRRETGLQAKRMTLAVSLAATLAVSLAASLPALRLRCRDQVRAACQG